MIIEHEIISNKMNFLNRNQLKDNDQLKDITVDLRKITKPPFAEFLRNR